MTLGIDCIIQDVGDGRHFCLPTGVAFAQLFFADALCNQPLAFVTRSPGCDAADPVYARDFNSGCGAQTFFEVTARVNPAQLFVFNGNGTCVESTVLDDRDYYQLGPAVPLSTFQSATIATE
jgi:hypothetical protein